MTAPCLRTMLSCKIQTCSTIVNGISSYSSRMRVLLVNGIDMLRQMAWTQQLKYLFLNEVAFSFEFISLVDYMLYIYYFFCKSIL